VDPMDNTAASSIALHRVNPREKENSCKPLDDEASVWVTLLLDAMGFWRELEVGA
jgi:hypothetical protein